MTAKHKALIVAAIAVAFSGLLIVWQVRAGNGEDVSLSQQDMALVVNSLPVSSREQLAVNQDARRQLATQLKELLAVAAEARVAGFADKPGMREKMDLQRKLIIAELYAQKKQEEAAARKARKDAKAAEAAL